MNTIAFLLFMVMAVVYAWAGSFIAAGFLLFCCYLVKLAARYDRELVQEEARFWSEIQPQIEAFKKGARTMTRLNIEQMLRDMDDSTSCRKAGKRHKWKRSAEATTFFYDSRVHYGSFRAQPIYCTACGMIDFRTELRRVK